MRQFIAESDIDKNGCLFVTGKKFRYLSTVLRCSAGDMIDVRLLDGTLQPMTVARIDSQEKKIVLQVAGDRVQIKKNEARALEKNSALPEMWLFQFVAKPPKMELIIRQATECGVSTILPVNGEFCQKPYVESAIKKSASKDMRWERIVTEARQQSGSPLETKVSVVLSLEEAVRAYKEREAELSCSKEESLKVVLYEQSEGTVPLGKAVCKTGLIKLAAFVVGAEGGISPQEIETLKKTGFIPVHLQTNILRCETAALYAAAALQTLLLENVNGA